MEESGAIHQQNPGRSEDEDSDSQPTDSSPAESQLKSSISSDAPGAPDKN
ncbi:MAG: hypothetical protein KH812_21140 [Proteus hauseri]|nr:hypothetical protein [Proteus hauseri]